MAKQDRRIRKTKAVLKTTLLSLMKEKSVKHITVKELCENADINRGTFYLHYRDVFDMLEEIEVEMFNELNEYLSVYENERDILNEDLFLKIFTFVKKNNEFCTVMLSDRGEIGFTKKLVSFLHTKFAIHYRQSNTAEHYFSFVVYGYLGMVEHWLNTGMKESPEEMAVMCENIISNKLREQL